MNEGVHNNQKTCSKRKQESQDIFPKFLKKFTEIPNYNAIWITDTELYLHALFEVLGTIHYFSFNNIYWSSLCPKYISMCCLYEENLKENKYGEKKKLFLYAFLYMHIIVL